MEDIDRVDGKYGLLPDNIKEKLKSYEYLYFREDKPVPFKELFVYPVSVRDFEIFSSCSNIFSLNKNETAEGIKMSNLDYLIFKMKSSDKDEGKIFSYKVDKIFELIFHIKNGIKCSSCGEIIPYDGEVFKQYLVDYAKFVEKSKEKNSVDKESIPKLVCPKCGKEHFTGMIKIVPDPDNNKKECIQVGDTIINKNDFNLLRQLVLFQNFPDYFDDSWVDPEIKKDHDEKIRIEQQKNDVHASIEKKVICLSISTNYKPDEIYNMSIRRFTMALSAVDDLINYKIMKQSVSSGFVSLPKGKTIEHWIYKPNKDLYGDSYKDTDDIKQSVANT